MGEYADDLIDSLLYGQWGAVDDLMDAADAAMSPQDDRKAAREARSRDAALKRDKAIVAVSQRNIKKARFFR